MAITIHYEGKFLIPTSVEAAADMPEKWANGLVNNAAIINDRRIAKIGDEGTFQTKIAGPSSTKFQPMIDDDFVSQSGRNASNIKRSQYKNLASSFNHWSDKLDLAFATVDGVVAKRFKDQVNNSKDNWASIMANKTLRITGDKIRGLYTPQAAYWMTGDPLANQMTNGHTLLTGAPYDFTQGVLSQVFRAAVVNLLTQCAVMIIDADMLAAEITAQNTRLNALAQMFKDAAIDDFAEPDAAPTSYLGYVYNDPDFLLHVRIQETTV